MADTPTGRNQRIIPLRVAIEDAPGSRNFVDDCRAEVEELSLGCDEDVSKATLRIWAGPVPEAPGRAAEGALSPANVLNGDPRVGLGPYLTPDQEVMIYRELPAGRQILFSGFCDTLEYREQSHAAETSVGFTFLVEGALKSLATFDHAQIVGRWMRTATAQDDLDGRAPEDPQNPIPPRLDERPIGDATSVGLVRALPCVFNPEGHGNRAAAPISVEVGSRTLLIHVFTHDGDPDGQPWTWAQALRYLTFFHMFSARTGDSLDALGSLVLDGNTFDITDALATLRTSDRPHAPVSIADAFKFAMLGRPASWRNEGMNFVEAIVLLADATGTHFRVKTSGESGLPVNRIYWWARGAGAEKTLAREGWAAGDTPAQILSKNNTNKFTIRAEYSDVYPRPVIVGDAMRWEITTELLPGWIPDPHLDDVMPENVAAEIAFAEEHWGDLDADEVQSDPWFQAYHKRGSAFQQHRDVGRRWVLNETGRYHESIYARGQVFTADMYQPWEPSDCSIIEEYVTDEGNIAMRPVPAGSWARIGRPLEDCLSADREGRSLGVVIEFSFDAGATWCSLPGTAARSLEYEAGIYIDADDLTRITKPNDDETEHLWKALITGNLRVRVTATIAGDRRLEPNLNVGVFGDPGSASRIFDVADRFKWASKELANSQFRSQGPKPISFGTLECRDDMEEIQRYATGLSEIVTRRQVPATLCVPWITTDYEVGDRISSITGLGISLWTSGGIMAERHPDVVSVVYGRAETRIILEDVRLRDAVLGAFA